LERKRHIAYLKRGLNGLGRWGSSLDASKPWLVYWIFHSLDLLEYKFDDALIAR
jgi:protein farnesyltransferase subunit beta